MAANPDIIRLPRKRNRDGRLACGRADVVGHSASDLREDAPCAMYRPARYHGSYEDLRCELLPAIADLVEEVKTGEEIVLTTCTAGRQAGCHP